MNTIIDKLHYISQQPENDSHLTAISQALEAGCKWVQLRVKNQPVNVILEYAIEANRLCKQYGAKLIVNDHPEIALKAGAYGVHLGLQDMSVAQARRIVGQKLIIGGTANTFQHVQQRVAEGVDYIGCGPYRFTTTKEKLSPILGLDGFKSIVKQMHAASMTIPIIGIGGVLPEDITALMDAGLYGVAMSGAITRAADPKAIVEHSYQRLNVPPINELI
ncbi:MULTISPECIES: thiamine phosphate synthase [unclassified Mucilaginibacter]|uniref:thiamine phosphate synthase n=1 Tax=unclassified Mucilaginibacter TaxID=2617802 RepID=UPI002AC972E1|nr:MULTISPECIES: thiamine phosphate synthase [unclassified Mucilaginibacter]MEB0261979.1 thiamine phosphate synthase [Mucilaginibacter sp. 10I4]MEB0277279.1 thiamine phosphate synthase [Mucilaginibacter sp. 10B2]MEB0300857.1 thiamine phosphate synthase [Mucilaginibacter sp. 5C4]WPX25405.1 thiamine phosphate synthase [Mucilaginibacter sp. 5C4]